MDSVNTSLPPPPTPSPPPSPPDRDTARAFWQGVMRLLDKKERGKPLDSVAERKALTSLVSAIHQITPCAASAMANYDKDLAWMQWQSIIQRAEHRVRALRCTTSFYDQTIDALLDHGIGDIPSPLSKTPFLEVDVVVTPKRSRVLQWWKGLIKAVLYDHFITAMPLRGDERERLVPNEMRRFWSALRIPSRKFPWHPESLRCTWPEFRRMWPQYQAIIESAAVDSSYDDTPYRQAIMKLLEGGLSGVSSLPFLDDGQCMDTEHSSPQSSPETPDPKSGSRRPASNLSPSNGGHSSRKRPRQSDNDRPLAGSSRAAGSAPVGSQGNHTGQDQYSQAATHTPICGINPKALDWDRQNGVYRYRGRVMPTMSALDDYSTPQRPSRNVRGSFSPPGYASARPGLNYNQTMQRYPLQPQYNIQQPNTGQRQAQMRLPQSAP